MNLTNLRAANVARDQEWNTGSERVSMTFRATELAGEVGEACNVIKKLERERIGLVGSRDTKEHLAEELADIVICTDLVAMDAGIDLDAEIAAKFNATSEKNGLTTRLSISMPAMALPFEATQGMIKAALDLVWEESETHDDLVCRLWRAMAAVAPDQPSAAPELALDGHEINLAQTLCRDVCGNDSWHDVYTYRTDYYRSLARSAIRSLSYPDHAEASKVEGGGWLPFESAPRDGTVIDLWCEPHDAFEVGNACRWPGARFDGARWRTRYVENIEDCWKPTHWRSLPTPPSTEVA